MVITPPPRPMSRGETLDTIGLDEHKPENENKFNMKNKCLHSKIVIVEVHWIRHWNDNNWIQTSERLSSRLCHLQVESYKAFCLILPTYDSCYRKPFDYAESHFLRWAHLWSSQELNATLTENLMV